MAKQKQKTKKSLKYWWDNDETVQWFKEKITIKRALIFFSVLANIIMLIIIVAMI